MSTIMKSLSRQKQQKCEICSKSFAMLVQPQHQCKRCQRAVCQECGQFKGIVIDYDLKKQHRVCTICKDEQKNIQEFIQKEQIIFNKNSHITKEWLQYFFIDKAKEQIINDDFYAKLAESENNLPQQISENLKLIQGYVNQIRAQYNFSMKEFNYYLTKDLQDNTAQIQISSVLLCLMKQDPNIKCTYNLVQLTYFLLYFNSKPLVHYFITILRDEFQFYRFLENNEQLQEKEIDFLQEIGKKNYLIEPTDLLYFRKYLEKYAYQMISSLFINHVNVQSIIDIFNHIFKFKDYFELEKITALIGVLNLNDFKLKGLDEEFFILQIIKNTNRQVLRDYLSKTDKLRLNQKRDTYSKSEDIIQSNIQKKQSYDETKQILYILDQCVLKQQPLNNRHKHLIESLNLKQQQIIYDLIGLNSNSLNQIKFEKSELTDQTKAANVDSI